MLKRQGLLVNYKVVWWLIYKLGITREAHEHKPREQQARLFTIPELAGRSGGYAPRAGMGHRHHVYPIEKGVHLVTSDNEYVHAAHPGLASVTQPGARVDARGLEESVAEWVPGDVSFRSGGAICSNDLHRVPEIPRGGDQHGERRRTQRQWIYRDVDKNDQGGASRPERVPGPGRRLEAAEKVP